MIDYIKPNQIESSLLSLWQKHQTGNVIRASLFNLVIYTRKDFREEYLQKIAKNIIRKFPCRMIVITYSETPGEDFLRTYVTDLTPESKENNIFCDIIQFEVGGTYKDRIPFLVLPHLLPDLPVYLIWGDDPTRNDPISIKLENYATRTIFDSETAEHLTDFAATLLNLHKQIFCEIGDLNWARCAPWRGLFAHAFNCPEKLKSLVRTKNLHITYNTTETKNFSHNKIQALYFQGWLAASLGWNYETLFGTKEELCIKYQTLDGPVVVTLTPTRIDGVLPGRIVKVDLVSRDSDHILFEIHKEKPSEVAVQYTTSSKCAIPLHHLFDKELAGKAIIQEIYASSTSSRFIKVLELITKYTKEIISS